MAIFEGWAQKIVDLADHTFVKCPENGAYFDCWGQDHKGPDLRKICSGEGIYEVADCYRHTIEVSPKLKFPDTADIGSYAVNGVCHQTANLFLYSARTVLNTKVHGYFASVALYGIYGNYSPGNAFSGFFFSSWLKNVYDPCYNKYKSSRTRIIAEEPAAPTAEDELFRKIQACHEEVKQVRSLDISWDVIVQEAAVLAQYLVDELDTAKFTDIHRDLLRERDAILKTDIRGEKLAKELNDLIVQFQQALSDRIGSELYSRLTGMAPGDAVNVVDPKIAAMARDIERR